MIDPFQMRLQPGEYNRDAPDAALLVIEGENSNLVELSCVVLDHQRAASITLILQLGVNYQLIYFAWCVYPAWSSGPSGAGADVI